MDADWYTDPLGRFDGRFFDGETWTERVSDDGSLGIDPDFPPAAKDAVATPVAGPEEAHQQDSPAVAPVVSGRRLQASLMKESPVRTVAVIDNSLLRPADVRDRSRGPVVWGLLGLIAALVVAGLLLLDRGPSEVTAEPVELDQEQAARVQDLEEGGTSNEIGSDAAVDLEVDAPVGSVAPGATFDPSEAIDVGGLRVLNGTSVLADLATWHRGFAAARGIELDATAACWFGQLGGAAVQVAHCGPVGGTAATEFLFDSVPLLFEPGDGGEIAQPVIDAATADTVLANALTLVGNPDNPPPLALRED